MRAGHGQDPRPRRRGRPRVRPGAVLAGKAYSSRAIRDRLRNRWIRAVVPQSADQIATRRRRGRAGCRPLAFVDAKTATIYQAALRLAVTHIWTAR
ncbi:hypothetical protein [Streptomyces sp. WAC01526]|uniref:hypothetical protein n=1 Tax=Streptomyces sp. WAC01526 TaxID=2588709 RepID=UPI0011E0078A